MGSERTLILCISFSPYIFVDNYTSSASVTPGRHEVTGSTTQSNFCCCENVDFGTDYRWLDTIRPYTGKLFPRYLTGNYCFSPDYLKNRVTFPLEQFHSPNTEGQLDDETTVYVIGAPGANAFRETRPPRSSGDLLASRRPRFHNN